jgi:[acyl-carrier-protein] S-malonyltransferase
MTLALLFPGQGTQHADMLPWLEQEPACHDGLARLAVALGADWRSRLHDSAWSTGHGVAQCLITGLGLAAWDGLAARLPAPAAIAGYSVGELAAFAVAGVFDAATALALAADRASAMQRSVAGLDTGLLAVQGLPMAALEAAAARHGLALALRLGPQRAVFGGLAAALDAAQSDLVPAGARCNRLAVRVASHTPWVAAAAQAFAERLTGVEFAAPRATLVCNLDGAARREPSALRAALAGQIASPVPWDVCMDALSERRVRCVLEVGPGSTLARLWSERHPGIPARSVDEFQSPAAAAAWVMARLR